MVKAPEVKTLRLQAACASTSKTKKTAGNSVKFWRCTQQYREKTPAGLTDRSCARVSGEIVKMCCSQSPVRSVGVDWTGTPLVDLLSDPQLSSGRLAGDGFEGRYFYTECT